MLFNKQIEVCINFRQKKIKQSRNSAACETPQRNTFYRAAYVYCFSYMWTTYGVCIVICILTIFMYHFHGISSFDQENSF